MSKKDILFRKIVPLRGPNVWTYRPVLEAWVDIGELENFPSNKIPGYPERLKAMLPSLVEHRCSYEERGGFLRRLDEGTWPAHILEHVTLELQNLAGLPGGFGRARETSERGVYKVAIRAWQEDVTRTALSEARELIMAAMEDRPFDVDAAVEKLTDMVDSLCLGPSTASIVDAADDRDIPAIRLLDDGNLVQLGYGAAMRRIWTAESDRTSAIAEGISRDKDLTKSLLQSCGVPVPEGREVDSPEDAWEAAQDIGLPVVVKPVDGNHGRGVFIDLKTREEVEKAYSVAVDEGSGVLVERSIPGTEHRLLVIGGKLVAANRGDMIKVTGDGKSTVRELITTQINCDPRRGPTENHPLSVIRIDTAARIELERQGLTGDSVPEAGREVLIQRNANHEFDCTDEVHPDTAYLASLAARVVGLDIAGIDLVAEDISRPLAAQGGAVVEVNAGPSLLMHLKPGVGKPRPVGKAIVEHLFPKNASGRIPVVGITGSRGKTGVARILRHLLQITGEHVGAATSDGLFLGRRHVEKQDCAHWPAARRVLMSRAVEVAVFENGPAAILGEGLAYDRCQVGIVTNLIDHAHLAADFDVHSLDQLWKALRTQVDVVLDAGASVLNAADKRVVEMAELSDGEVIFYAIDPDTPALVEHRKKDGRSVYVRDGYLTLAVGEDEEPLIETIAFIGTPAGCPAHAVENLLAAVAAAWALDLSADLLRTGISTYEIDETPAG
ncbi:MAG: cyanophycin synthetase [Rhodocyclaceae bacterium]|nr:cyanophycin synthetase [Rhodocyclaceae bacterium]